MNEKKIDIIIHFIIIIVNIICIFVIDQSMNNFCSTGSDFDKWTVATYFIKGTLIFLIFILIYDIKRILNEKQSWFIRD